MTQTGGVAESRLSDWISLGVLASWVPRDEVEDAVEAAGKTAKRKGGKLPPQVMVYFVMALALFADEDYEEVWARLTETLAGWGGFGDDQALVTTGGLAQARQRLGHEPVKGTFELVAAPVATLDTPGAFLGNWRKMSIDGLEWDLPDTAANAAEFGYPGAGGGGRAAFPKARAVTIGECASHAPVLAAIGPCVSKGSGEQSLARELYPRLEEDWLLIADRNFYNWAGLVRRRRYRGGAAVAGEIGPDPGAAGVPHRRLLPVRAGEPQGQGRRAGEDPRGGPRPGGPRPRPRPGTSAWWSTRSPTGPGPGRTS